MVKEINKGSSGCIISRHLTADKLILQHFVFVFRNPPASLCITGLAKRM